MVYNEPKGQLLWDITWKSRFNRLSTSWVKFIRGDTLKQESGDWGRFQEAKEISLGSRTTDLVLPPSHPHLWPRPNMHGLCHRCGWGRCLTEDYIVLGSTNVTRMYMSYHKIVFKYINNLDLLKQLKRSLFTKEKLLVLHQHDSLQLPVTPVPRDSVTSSGLCEHHSAHMYTHWHNTHSHKL